VGGGVKGGIKPCMSMSNRGENVTETNCLFTGQFGGERRVFLRDKEPMGGAAFGAGRDAEGRPPAR
jgi:hypothetical protein